MLETIVLSWRLTQRHWAIYRKDLFANILPTLTDPAFFILSLGIGLGAYVSDLKGMHYVTYMAPGLIVSAALFTSFYETSYNFYVRLTYEGIYKAALTTPIGVKEILIGEAFWVALKGAGMSSCVGVVLLAFGVVEPNYIFLLPILGSLVGLSCGAIGLIATSLVKNINQFQTIHSLLINPMFFFSGIFFPITDLPKVLQVISKLSPLYHGVRMGQEILWNGNIAAAIAFHGPCLVIMSIFFCLISYRLIYSKLYT